MQGFRAYRAANALASFGVALVMVAAPGMQSVRGDGPAATRRDDQEALKAYAPVVGSWRGIGQVERGRPRGAWQESAVWAWKLTPKSAALEVTVSKGKYLKSGALRPAKIAGSFVFEVVLADGSPRVVLGNGGGGLNQPLVLSADADAPASGLRRVTITPLHETRLLVLLEAEDPERHVFSRLGEVGYTREGVAFAAGDSSPLCIVTEGRGTITVSHKGKTYYVCCTGCRDLFNENPEAVLAEAAARAKEKEKEKGQK